MALIKVLSTETNNNNKDAFSPLSSLSKTLGLSTHNYPSDLGTDGSKKHYVTFQAKEITPQTYNIGTIITSFGSYVKAEAIQIKEFAKTEISNVVSGETGATQPAVTTPSPELTTANANLAAEGNKLQGVLQTLNESMDIKKNRTAVKSFIALYMPDTLQATYKADYASISLRDELGSLNSIRAVGSVAATALGPERGFENTTNAIGSDPNTIKWAIDSFAKMFNAGQGLSSGILQTQGYTSNPQLQMIYQGAPFRSFTLNFVFTPKSMAEARDVERIIHEFKYYAAPTLQTPGKSPSASMFLTPPALFEVKFYYDGAENPKLPKYTDCVLEDIQIDYAPNGWAAHIDGAPIQTHLSLSFHEVEIVDRDRLFKGYFEQEGGLR
jgi:hypothetical protein